MKITDLSEAENLDGTETVPLVKDGKTQRGAVGGLVGAAVLPYVTQTQQSAAQAAQSAQQLAAVGLETNAQRYFNGRAVTFARVSVAYGMGDAITSDGYHWAKYSIRGTGGIGFAQAADGFWQIDGSNLLATPFTALNFTSGDSVSAPDQRYAYGKSIVWAAGDAAMRGGLMIASDGYVFGKFALRGAGGLTVSQASDGFWQLDGSSLLSTPFTALNFTSGDSVSAPDLRYAYGRQIIWAATDAARRGGLMMSADGYVFCKPAMRGTGGISFSQASDGFWQIDGSSLLSTPFTAINFTSGDSVDPSAQRYYNGLKVLWAVGGSSFRSPIIVTEDGSVTIPKLVSNTAGVTAMLDSTSYIFDVATIAGKRVLTRTSKTTGIKANATPTTSNAYAPRLSSDGTKVIYVTDRTGTTTSYYQALDGSVAGTSVEHPVMPLPGQIVGIGDSIMATSWLDPVAINFALALVTPTNVSIVAGGATAGGGIGSQKALQIAYRYGAGGYAGLPDLTCSLSGNAMTNGANLLTAISNPLLSRSADTAGAVRTLRASILGVTGVLQSTQQTTADSTTIPQVTNYSSDSYFYTFTPDAGQTLPSSVPANSVIRIDPEMRQDVPLIFHVGRNDSNAYTGWQANVQQAWASILAVYKPLGRKIIGIGVTNARTEPSGSAAYNAIVAFNVTIAAAYPDYFFDVRPYYNAGEATDIPNASYTDDGLHPNAAGKLNGFTTPIIAEINRRGWFA